jgi:hypothetical protein
MQGGQKDIFYFKLYFVYELLPAHQENCEYFNVLLEVTV